MPKTIISIKLWYCTNLPCEYHQEAEPTQQFMDETYPRVQAYKCPACCLGQNPQRQKCDAGLIYGKRVGHIDTITIMGEDELDTHEVPDETKQPNANGERPKRLLTASEKSAMRDKIQADIIKFKALEDK